MYVFQTRTGDVEIPASADLGLPDTICRICRKSYSSTRHRLRHEADVHKCSHIDGRTYRTTNQTQSCPPPSYQPSERELRVQSCPPMSYLPPGDDGDGDDEDKEMIPTCNSCCNTYSSRRAYRRHLPCRYHVRAQGGLILKPPNEEAVVKEILNNLAVSDRIELARTQNWTGDYWPFVFPIKDMNKCKCRNSEHLRQYFNVNDYIELPRRVIIKYCNASTQFEEGDAP